MPKHHVMGLFRQEDQVVSTIAELKASAFELVRVHSPIPSHKVMDALKAKKSGVGWFTLVGGILGFVSGFALASYCATRWNLIVSGKPVVAIIPFIIVGFEFTILFSVFGNVLGLLVLGGLPNYRDLQYHDPRCSGEHFGVLASCEDSQQEGLKDVFQKHGAEIRVFD
jgi:hypothetical protein